MPHQYGSGAEGEPAASGLVGVLNAEPDLAEGIPPEERKAAHRRSTARVVQLPTGPWRGRSDSNPGLLGALVLDGVIARRVVVDGRRSIELLGPGDVLSPSECEQDFGAVATASRWEVLEPCRLAVLDRHWHERLGRWPDIQAALAPIRPLQPGLGSAHRTGMVPPRTVAFPRSWMPEERIIVPPAQRKDSR